MLRINIVQNTKIMKLYTAYNNSLQRNPLVTKMLTSGTICGLGDLLC
jgi:hypothetical protein